MTGYFIKLSIADINKVTELARDEELSTTL